MIEFADVELAMPFEMRVPVSMTLVCQMCMDVDGRLWIPDKIFVYDDEQMVFRGMQHERSIERTRVVPRILCLKVVRLGAWQSFRWKDRVNPEYRWCQRINWIRTLETCTEKVALHLIEHCKNEIGERIEAKEKGV